MPWRRGSRHSLCASRPGRRGRRGTGRNGARVGGRTPGARRPSARLRRCRCPRGGGGQTWRASESTGDCGSVGAGGRGSRKKSWWGVMATSGRGAQRQDSRGGGRDGKTCSLPHGIRTGPVPNEVGASSRDQPHQRAHGTKAGTVTTTHGLPTRIARNTRAGPVPSTCEAAQPPRPLTLMRSPVVKRQTTPMSGFFPIFSAVFAASQSSRGTMS